MENNEKLKVRINIAGSEFTVLSQDSENYTLSVAKEVDEKISEIRKANPNISITAAVMLAALNFCDCAKKSENDADNFRKQIKEYLTEAAQKEKEADELRKENERLKKDIQTYRQRLSEEIPSDNNAAPVSSAVKAVKKSVLLSDVEEAAEDDAEFFDIKNME
ncbi:MAG: cell division protein ZapA [Acutalibacteraceae bacterium]